MLPLLLELVVPKAELGYDIDAGIEVGIKGTM